MNYAPRIRTARNEAARARALQYVILTLTGMVTVLTIALAFTGSWQAFGVGVAGVGLAVVADRFRRIADTADGVVRELQAADDEWRASWH